jgi:YfiH family protein
MLQVKRQDQITFLQSEALSRVPGIIHAFSTRRSERRDLTLGPHSSSDPRVQINRIRFLAAVEAPGWPIMKLKQVHSGVVADMDDSSAATDAVEGDASVTAIKGVMLGVQTADCVPILIVDACGRAVAAIHAGWRGTASRIAESTVARLRAKFSIDPKDLIASIGPHIGVCCYEVGNDVVDAIAYPALFEYKPEWTRPHLNLAEANRRQLVNSGLVDRQVEISSLCTRCREDLFHSYRRDGKKTGHMLSVIGIVP